MILVLNQIFEGQSGDLLSVYNIVTVDKCLHSSKPLRY